jgi:NADPH2:quinone reductase
MEFARNRDLLVKNASSHMPQWWVVPGPEGGELEMREVAVPTPGPDEVLVEVLAAAVNRGELIGRAALRSDMPATRARPSGIEFAGRVVTAGEGVSDWTAGARVMGRGNACHAGYVVVDAGACMAIPDALTDIQAGAVPNVFVTAHDALVTAARMRRGEAVLISAGSSGVGTAAIQIAKYLGAQRIIATTRSAEKSRALYDLGATEVLDTGKENWAAGLHGSNSGVDVVIDQVGGALFPQLLDTLRIEGRYVTVGRNAGATSTVNLDRIALNRLSIIGVTFRTRSASEALACSDRFAEDLLGAFSADPQGQDGPSLQPVLDRVFPLSALPDAHEYMLSDQQIGKIVLVP